MIKVSDSAVVEFFFLFFLVFRAAAALGRGFQAIKPDIFRVSPDIFRVTLTFSGCRPQA